jgi:hypothetical protein
MYVGNITDCVEHVELSQDQGQSIVLAVFGVSCQTVSYGNLLC